MSRNGREASLHRRICTASNTATVSWKKNLAVLTKGSLHVLYGGSQPKPFYWRTHCPLMRPDMRPAGQHGHITCLIWVQESKPAAGPLNNIDYARIGSCHKVARLRLYTWLDIQIGSDQRVVRQTEVHAREKHGAKPTVSEVFSITPLRRRNSKEHFRQKEMQFQEPNIRGPLFLSIHHLGSISLIRIGSRLSASL
jgi:hypothetical protein